MTTHRPTKPVLGPLLVLLVIVAIPIIAVIYFSSTGDDGAHPDTSAIENDITQAGADCDWERTVHDDYTETRCGDQIALILADDQDVVLDQWTDLRDEFDSGCNVVASGRVILGDGDEAAGWIDDGLDQACTEF